MRAKWRRGPLDYKKMYYFVLAVKLSLSYKFIMCLTLALGLGKHYLVFLAYCLPIQETKGRLWGHRRGRFVFFLYLIAFCFYACNSRNTSLSPGELLPVAAWDEVYSFSGTRFFLHCSPFRYVITPGLGIPPQKPVSLWIQNQEHQFNNLHSQSSAFQLYETSFLGKF